MEHLLFLCHRIPYPPDKGDKIRSWHILRQLARRYHVHLGCLRDAAEDERHVGFLRTICASVNCQPLNPRLAKLRSIACFASGEALTIGYFRNERLQRWVAETLRSHRPSRIFVFCSAMAPYVLDSTADQRILDMVDVDSEKWRQYAAHARWPMRAIYAREQRLLLALERKAAAAFDKTLLVSPAEAALFASLAPEAAARLAVLRNGVDADYFNPEHRYPNPYAGRAPRLVFTGAMDYRPNIDAVAWFSNQVMPHLRRSRPSLEFWIVGANPTAAVRGLAGLPGIHVTGRVEDVRPYLAHADAMVAPLTIARGVQNKVLEAMAMARPVVATPEACAGIDAVPEEEILTARAPDEFAAAVDCILLGEKRGLGCRARGRVLRDYQWNLNGLGSIFGDCAITDVAS